MLNNTEDLQFITLFFVLGRLEINKVSSIINFIFQLVSFLHLGTLSRTFNIFTIAMLRAKLLDLDKMNLYLIVSPEQNINTEVAGARSITVLLRIVI